MINRCLKKCPHGKNKSCGQFGFTLVELLFVCFILGIIAAVAVPNFSVIVRRLHDVGKSGWFLLIGLIPYIGAFILFIKYLTPSIDTPSDETEQSVTQE